MYAVLYNSFSYFAFQKPTRARLETVEYLKAMEARNAALDMDDISVHRGIDSDVYSRATSRTSMSR